MPRRSGPCGTRVAVGTATPAGVAAQIPESPARWFLPGTVAQSSWGVRYARLRVLRMRVEDLVASW